LGYRKVFYICNLTNVKNKDGGYMYIHADSQEELMKYDVEMDSGAMIYVPSFIKIGSAIQKLIRGIHRHTDRMEIGKPTFIFFFKITKVG
jgi:hypothetical protein